MNTMNDKIRQICRLVHLLLIVIVLTMEVIQCPIVRWDNEWTFVTGSEQSLHLQLYAYDFSSLQGFLINSPLIHSLIPLIFIDCLHNNQCYIA